MCVYIKLVDYKNLKLLKNPSWCIITLLNPPLRIGETASTTMHNTKPLSTGHGTFPSPPPYSSL